MCAVSVSESAYVRACMRVSTRVSCMHTCLHALRMCGYVYMYLVEQGRKLVVLWPQLPLRLPLSLSWIKHCSCASLAPEVRRGSQSHG